MKNPKSLTNKQRVFDYLKKEGASSVGEIAQGTSLEKRQIRNVVSADYTGTFVYVGERKYNLAINALVGVKFRYYPTKEELEKGILKDSSSLVDFLLFGNYQLSISLIDSSKRNYLIKYRAKRGKVGKPFEAYLYPLKRFFRNNKITSSDGLIFTTLDFENRIVKVEKLLDNQSRLSRSANKYIADILYQFLKNSIRKHEFLFFLNRRIVPFYKKIKIAADLPEKIVSEDGRFILYDSYSKKPILKKNLFGREVGVGIRKYTVLLPNGKLAWAVIEKDEFGYYGFCDHCGIPLFWHRKKGWYHPRQNVSEFEVFREDIELDKEFFKKD